MSKRWPFSVLNDEQKSTWIGVKHLPVALCYTVIRYKLDIRAPLDTTAHAYRWCTTVGPLAVVNGFLSLFTHTYSWGDVGGGQLLYCLPVVVCGCFLHFLGAKIPEIRNFASEFRVVCFLSLGSRLESPRAQFFLTGLCLVTSKLATRWGWFAPAN